MAASGRHTGWYFDVANSRLDFYYRGTRVGSIDANSLDPAQNTSVTGTIVASAQISNTTGDIRAAAGNLRLGVVSTFATTEPTEAVVMKQGTQPSGAITTSGVLYSTATVVGKMIANGTNTNVET